MLVIFLPANVYAAWNGLHFGGNVVGPTYLLLRVPYQLFVVLWTVRHHHQSSADCHW